MRIFLFYFLFICQFANAQDFAAKVNPFVGTGGHGHTFPGATLPFGMVQLSPDTRIDGSWDGCSGYHYSDSLIYGFSHTHLSGTGVSDYGDVMLMPVKGEPKFLETDYASKFSHQNEKASPGYYSVFLDEPEINVELTSSTRVGFHKYTVNESGLYSVMLDLTHRDELVERSLEVVNTHRVEGFRRSKAWAKNQVVYFVIEFSKEMVNHKKNEGAVTAGYSFQLTKGETLQIKVGISFTSIEGAAKNLEKEVPHWDFNKVKKEAEAAWNQELRKIEVSDENPERQAIFYTALYHCMMHPNVAMDVDSNYLGHDRMIHKATNHTQYTVFSLWDTYRALHPLLTIIDTKRTGDFINSFLKIYAQGGRLPVWELCSNETDCMIGYHSASVITDAYIKGITNFDTELALEAMMTSSNSPLFGLPSYNKYGYVRAEDEAESVSKNLEYAYDDWCISVFAEKLGKPDIAAEYALRSQRWKNSFDSRTGFMTPRINDYWLDNFDPKQVNNHFTEANAWQYSFYVPHDIPGLIEAHGGPENFEKKLDQLFGESTETTGREQSDITGLIGQYAHGNEPSHHIAYLYNYVDRPDKTQALVNKICDSFYTLKPDGLIGNEDCGQMSAWYVLSASGFYPVAPGGNYYVTGIPQFQHITFHLDSAKTFRIKSINKTKDAITATPSHVFTLQHTTFETTFRLSCSSVSQYYVVDGESILTFDFGKDPKLDPGVMLLKKPFQGFILTPLIKGKKVFEGCQNIEIIGSDTQLIWYFTNMDTVPKKYNGPFNIDRSTTVYTFFDSNVFKPYQYLSPTAEATFYKKQNNWKVEVFPAPNPQYTAGGEDALVDGIRGTTNWRAGGWQGYQEVYVDILIRLDKRMMVSELEFGFLQDARSWILLPSAVEFGTGHFWRGLRKGSVQKIATNAFTDSSFTKTVILKAAKPRKAKLIVVYMKSAGKLPEGHPGHTINGDSFIFIDEVIVR